MTQISDRQALETLLSRIDGKSYGAYRDLSGDHDFGDMTLRLGRIQRDPFAPPTMAQIDIDFASTGFAQSYLTHESRQIALCDFVARKLWRMLDGRKVNPGGSGNSGRIEIAEPGQEILERTSVYVANAKICCRLYVGLPAKGRRIQGARARTVLCDVIPEIVRACMLADPADEVSLCTHADVNEDQDALREMLRERNWVAFVADNSILPRAAGNDDRPPLDTDVVPFAAPGSLRHEVKLPRSGAVSGMAIPVGVTLIVGGGYHGKSTLLQALSKGVYNHIPGDGRECVVTQPNAVKVRSEEGRSVSRVDLRPFIDELPGQLDATCFSTRNASGSTSQAASVVEYLSAGATALLIDEDSSASNFLYRDPDMVALVPDHEEPIRPFVRYVRSLADDAGVSTVMAMGGSSAYFSEADAVLRMRDYRVEEVTETAKGVKSSEGTARPLEARFSDRRVIKGTLGEGVDLRRVRVRDCRLSMGKGILDLTAVEQLRGRGQIEGIGSILTLCEDLVSEGISAGQIVARAMGVVDEVGFAGVVATSGRSERPRYIDVIAALNRARFLKWDSA